MKDEVSVRCACGHAIMELHKFDDGTTSFVFYEAYQPSLWLRIKKAWGYIRGKRLDAQNFVLYKEDMRKIANFVDYNYGIKSSISGKRLEEMSAEMDEWLESQSPEDLRQWLENHRREQALADMARMNQETGQYDPPFTNPLIKDV